jgi:hypothetical protein
VREVTWQDRPFVKTRVRTVLHIPLGFGRAVTRAKALIDTAGAQSEDNLMLADDVSPWHTDLYIAARSTVPGAQMASLSGTFLTKVYEGPFSSAPRWATDMKLHVERQHRTLEKLYFAYTTCPACAKAYGHNYVVLFAQVNA